MLVFKQPGFQCFIIWPLLDSGDFFPTLSNSAFETKFGSVYNGVPFWPQWSESKYAAMNEKMLSL